MMFGLVAPRLSLEKTQWFPVDFRSAHNTMNWCPETLHLKNIHELMFYTFLYHPFVHCHGYFSTPLTIFGGIICIIPRDAGFTDVFTDVFLPIVAIPLWIS